MMPSITELRRRHREQGRLLREAEKRSGVDPYISHKDYVAEKRREQTKVGREIGEPPEVANYERRTRCIGSFVEFCKTYLNEQFALPWSPYHYKAAEKIEHAVRYGGLYAFAMPRGSGKTTLSRAGVLWAILSGHAKCVVLLAAAERSAERHLKYGLKKTILRNPLLLEDFPHAIYPFRKLDGEARAAAGQLYRGEKTFIEWQANHITFAWIPHEDSLSNGAVIETMGMTAEIRGPLYTLPDGTQIRPQLVIADDPQTRESARSASQSQSRLETLTGDVAYLGGPAKPIAVVCPCTVIYENDLADQILNRDNHPEWQGERTQMVEAFPSNMEKWDEYAEILRASMREDGTGAAATEFYRANREAMDEGARISWPERFREDELSAIQHAMNLKIRDEAAFYSECQNEPIIAQDDLELLSTDEICVKVTGYTRGVVPPDCAVITAFTDIQKDHLFWMVCGWTSDFTGFVLDYGAWPDQKRNYFTRRDVRKRLSGIYTGDEGGIMFAALKALGEKLAGQPYLTADGREMKLGRWCIDGGWRSREQACRAYAKQSEFASVITLSYGRGVKASQVPFSEAQRAIKWRTGPGWFWSDGPGPARGVVFDANLWKKRIHNGLNLSTGSRGSISLFKAPPQVHRMLADHLLAEKPIKTEANGRTVYEWVEKPGQDNEGLDCLVGCALGASICGITPDTERIHKARTVTKSLSDWANAAKGK